MTDRLLVFSVAETEPEISRPDPALVLSGDPVHSTWNLEEGEGGLYAGVWRSTPGCWQIRYTEWEFCRIIEGLSVLTEAGKEAITLRADDSFVIRPGFVGTWEVVETTLKHYVIRL